MWRHLGGISVSSTAVKHLDPENFEKVVKTAYLCHRFNSHDLIKKNKKTLIYESEVVILQKV